MTALELAGLRAQVSAPVADRAALVAAAAAIGRTPVPTGRQTVLAPADDAPSVTDLGLAVATLPDLALVALGVAVGLGWRDRDRHPYPGDRFTVDDVTAAARTLAVNAGATAHVVGYLRHVLAHAGFVESDEATGTFQLGPAVAAWADADLEAFRRNVDVLPPPVAARSAEGQA